MDPTHPKRWGHAGFEDPSGPLPRVPKRQMDDEENVAPKRRHVSSSASTTTDSSLVRDRKSTVPISSALDKFYSQEYFTSLGSILSQPETWTTSLPVLNSDWGRAWRASVYSQSNSFRRGSSWQRTSRSTATASSEQNGLSRTFVASLPATRASSLSTFSSELVSPASVSSLPETLDTSFAIFFPELASPHLISSQPEPSVPSSVAAASEQENTTQGGSPRNTSSERPSAPAWEEDGQDEDEFLGPGWETHSTVSLDGNKTWFCEEFGHVYPASEAYLQPVDEGQHLCMLAQHRLFELVNGGEITLRPLPDSHQSVLDIGTGRGDWAIDYGEERPMDRIKAVDLCPIQYQFNINGVTFETFDAEGGDWNFSQKFDLIHLQDMDGCFTDMIAMMATIYDNLNPGGYVELKNLVLTPVGLNDKVRIEGTPVHILSTKLEQAARGLRRPLCAELFPTFLEEVGFTIIERKRHQIPCNKYWPACSEDEDQEENYKQRGRLFDLAITSRLRSMCIARLVYVLGWTVEEVEDLCDKAQSQLRDPGQHIFFWSHHVLAQRPINAVDVC